MSSIIYDYEIITPENHMWNYYYSFLNKLYKKDCVKFALFCAKIINNSKESNDRIELVEKWLIDENSVILQELNDAASDAVNTTDATDAIWAAAHAAGAAYSAAVSVSVSPTYYAAYALWACYSVYNTNTVDTYCATANINKYLQILLRNTKQFQNNKILEQISKTNIDTLELVDWNMITDIMLEEYNIIHEFEYNDIFSRRCLIELLRREYA